MITIKLIYANKSDLKIINEYFKDSGRIFTELDSIVVFDNVLQVADYLYSDNFAGLLLELNRRAVSNEDETLLENLVNDLVNVFQSDYGKYYVIK